MNFAIIFLEQLILGMYQYACKILYFLFFRLRIAQEIQRQLEEIEVKQKELEFKGVNVEKALRNKNR